MQEFYFFNALDINEFQLELHDSIVRHFNPVRGEFFLEKINPMSNAIALDFKSGKPSNRDGIEAFNNENEGKFHIFA
ncbi:hypothetical protein PG911_08770 [Tenacibaculum ovolyticum]|uniref:hypothetical protein n=1 Tax=Tenacibaculum ovolyticum TaxID=104270 RepID=UPI0022F3D95F|nr:hypothetical protein [Tenacibaculum ovolyticum]WBX78338.1 hypothetical protein PG911_08770 [Tenacibaculum ovolyticum]